MALVGLCLSRVKMSLQVACKGEPAICWQCDHPSACLMLYCSAACGCCRAYFPAFLAPLLAWSLLMGSLKALTLSMLGMLGFAFCSAVLLQVQVGVASLQLSFVIAVLYQALQHVLRFPLPSMPPLTLTPLPASPHPLLPPPPLTTHPTCTHPQPPPTSSLQQRAIAICIYLKENLPFRRQC